MNARVLAALAITWFGFGSVFMAMKIGVTAMPPVPLAALRFGAAGLLLTGIALFLERHRVEKLNAPQAGTTIVMGCIMAYTNGAAVYAITTMSSWMTAVLIATIPIWGFIFAVITKRRSARLLDFAGIAGGICGIALLVAPGGDVQLNVPVTLVTLGGAMAWGIGSVWERSRPLPHSPLLAVGLQMLVASVLLAIFVMPFGGMHGMGMHDIPSAVWIALAYMVIISGAITFAAYMWLVEVSDPTTANSFGYVAPVISVILGATFLHEPITLRTGLAIVLVVASVALLLAPHPARHKAAIPFRAH